MPSPLDIRSDAPGMLRTEAMGMTIKFDRTGPTTGRVSWNIPQPAAGCAADMQAYCGILVTVDGTSNNASKVPVNGVIYNSDATVDANLFAGDTIGTSRVIGAFYQDRTTTFFDVAGLVENAPYYVSGFPVDCQNRYYREGIHAYSLDYHRDTTQPTSGSQVVILNNIVNGSVGGVQLTDATGLQSGETYSFEIKKGLVPKPARPVTSQECVPTPWAYTISLDGAIGLTYGDLLTEITRQLNVLDNPPQSATPPNAGAYYYDSTQHKLYVWDGYQHTEQAVIVQSTSPVASTGTYWYNTTTKALQLWDGAAWQLVNVITFALDPLNPACETSYWFDGTNAYTWTGNAWFKHVIYTQDVDPSLVKNAPCGSFWYNTDTYELYSWDDTLLMWTPTNAVQYTIAPNALPDGTYWFNDTSKKLMIMSSGVWIEPTIPSSIPLTLATRVAEAEPTLNLTSDTLWYNPATMELKSRNTTNTAWIATDLIVFEADPTIITYCSNWWNTTTDEMFVWDGVNSQWNVVANFYQQSNDPTAPPTLAEEDMWYNPTTAILYYWQNGCFKATPYLLYPTDPRITIPDGTAWHDTTNDLWFIKTTGTWVLQSVVYSDSDLSSLPAGTMWFDTSSNTLQQWNGVAWVTVLYRNNPLTPSAQTKWYNTTTHELMEWNGSMWINATPLISVTLNCASNFIFTDTSTGSLSWINIIENNLFSSLTGGYILDRPVPGSDGVSSEPLYQEIGVGSDGTNDERLKLMNEIRYSLGYPIVDVEITPEQLHLCIDMALQTFREYSSAAYSRGFFFLQVNSEEQRYLLTNKVSGMNKIVNVLGIHRLTSAFLSSAHGAGVYGQIVMQHLYNMGTFDLLSYHIMTEYTKNLEILFAGRVTFTFNEQTRELWIHHRFPFSERYCLVDAAVERTEQHLLSDRLGRPWLRKWATAEAKQMLAQSRGKFSTLPGAGGGVTLNASDLNSQSQQEKEALLLEITDYVTDTPEVWGVQSTLTFG